MMHNRLSLKVVGLVSVILSLPGVVLHARERSRLPHESEVWALAMTPDNRFLVSGGEDGLVKVWDLKSGDLWTVLPGHTDPVFAAAISPDGKYLATGDRASRIFLWDLSQAMRVAILSGHPNASVLSLAFSPDGKYLASGGERGKINIWDAKTHQVAVALAGHDSKVHALAWAPAGHVLASGSADRLVKLWDVTQNRLVQEQRGHTSPVRCVAFSPDGKTLASGGLDRSIVLWNADGLTRQATLRCRDELRGLAFSPDGKTLAAGLRLGLQFWDPVRKQMQLDLFDGFRTTYSSVAFSNDGTLLAAAGVDRFIQLIDLVGGTPALAVPRQTLRGHDKAVGALAYTPKGDYLLSGDDTGVLKVWDAGTGELIQSLKGHRLEIYALVCSANGEVYTSSRDLTMKAWTRREGKLVLRSENKKFHEDTILGLGVDPAGGLLVTGSLDKSLMVFDMKTREMRVHLKNQPGGVRWVAVSPDGNLVAWCCDPDVVKVYDLTRERERHSFRVGSRPTAVVFSPDGKTIMASAVQGEVNCWDVQTGEKTTLSDRGSGTARSLAVSPDGKLLAIARYSETIELWNWRDRAKIAIVRAHPNSIHQVAFSPDGKSIASSGVSGAVKLWTVAPMLGQDIPGRAPFTGPVLVARGLGPVANPFPRFAARLPEELKGLRGRVAIQKEINNQMNMSYQSTDRGDWQGAAQHREYACALAAKAYGPNSRLAARYLASLATPYRQLARYDDARAVLHWALQQIEAKGNAEDMAVAEALGPLADLYFDTGDLIEAADTWERSAKVWEVCFKWWKTNERSPDVFANMAITIMEVKANDLDSVGTVWHQKMGWMTGGRPKGYKKESDYIAEQVVHDWARLSLVYLRLGQLEKSKAYMDRCLQRAREHFEADHATMAPLYGIQGEVHFGLGQFAQAREAQQRAVDIQTRTLGANAPILANSLRNLGKYYQAEGQLDRAEETFRKSLDLSQNRFGFSHPFTAGIRLSLGLLYLDLGKPDQAGELVLQGHKDLNKNCGEFHLETMRASLAVGRLHAARGDWDRAHQVIGKTFQQLHHYALTVLPLLSEYEQADFLAHQMSDFLGRTMLALKPGFRHEDIGELAAEILLNVKGLSLETLARRARLAHVRQDPEIAGIFQELTDTRALLADKTIARAPEKELADLAVKEEGLSRQLGRLCGKALSAPTWITLADFRARIPADAAVVQTVRASWELEGANPPQSLKQYLAWVIPSQGKGNLKLVQLGEPAAVDEEIKKYRQEMEKAAFAISAVGEARAEQALRESMKNLEKLLLAPLLPHLGQARRWMISPDGDLWFVSWAALPLGAANYVVDNHTVSYLISGRELLQQAGDAAAGPPLVMAAPNFNVNLLDHPAPAREPAEVVEQILELRRGGDPYQRNWSAIAGGDKEIPAIEKGLEKYIGVKPWIYQGDEAQEGIYKQARSPRVIVFITHGFSLPPTDSEGKLSIRNTLLRCGLILAGANQRLPFATTTLDNGILTGLEILSSDCHGTILVVMSACETGLGANVHHEGVVGLRHAFLLAGVPSVAATLWKIPDLPTAELMDRFWAHLADGKDHAMAMSEAQRDILKSRRAREKAGHPFYWAGFTMTGSPFVNVNAGKVNTDLTRPAPIKPGALKVIRPEPPPNPLEEAPPQDLVEQVKAFALDPDLEVAIAHVNAPTPEEGLKLAQQAVVREMFELIAIKDAFADKKKVLDGLAARAEMYLSAQETIVRKVEGKCYVSLVGGAKISGLQKALRDAKIPVRVAGAEELARQVAQQRRDQRSAALFKALFSNYPFGCIRAEVAGKEKLVGDVGETARISLPVKFTVDRDAYERFSRQFLLVLRATARAGKPFTLSYALKENTLAPDELGYRDRTTSLLYGVPEEITAALKTDDETKLLLFCPWIGRTSTPNQYRAEWLYLIVPKDCIGSMNQSNQLPPVFVRVLDKQGKELAVRKGNPNDDYVCIAGTYKVSGTVGNPLGGQFVACVTPLLGSYALHQRPQYTQEFHIELPVEVAEKTNTFMVELGSPGQR